MQDLANKVAVITGAASGFGRELAVQCAGAGMKLVLADRDQEGLGATLALLPGATDVITAICDVSKPCDVDNLAEATYARFGAAHLLFNNAGVAVSGPTWTTTLDEWKWVLDVNLMGVVHGIRSFVPRMLAQGQPAHIVNTASAAGLVSPPGSSVYCVSKHGVVTLSECLHHELQLEGAPIGVSVLCPAFVPTGIGHSERNRPAEFADANPLGEVYAEAMRKAIAAGKLTAADVARITLEGVQAGRFYIITHPTIKKAIEIRMQDILEERLPTNTLRVNPR
ncbi:SDR family NAD(P)-dependent oxidoreductase [Zavarzinia sp.]|uniref:SDR family NAD(P)-dependent oxidoreductase n=1 Tax=Zavarzinia sp. TaxID=2027920 RepID=UPI003BB5A5D5